MIINSASSNAFPIASLRFVSLRFASLRFVVLQSNHRHPPPLPRIDCATNLQSPRPKAGVFAVRAGAMVRENVLNYSQGLKLTEFELQTEFLGLISTGDKYAVASRGEQALEGEMFYKLKDAIDVTWMAGFQILPGERNYIYY